MMALGLFAFVTRLSELNRGQIEGLVEAYEVALASSNLVQTVEQAVAQVGAVIMAPDTTTARSKSASLEDKIAQVDSQRRILLSKIGDHLPEAEKIKISLMIDEFISYQTDTAQLCLKFSPQAAIIQANDKSTTVNREHMLAEVKQLHSGMVRSAEEMRKELAASQSTRSKLLQIVPASSLMIGALMVAALMRGRQAKTNKQRFDSALDTMSQGFCLVDDTGRLLVVNSRLQVLFGLTEDLVGQSVQEMARRIVIARQIDDPEALKFLMNFNLHVQNMKAAVLTAELGQRIFDFRFDPLADGGLVLLAEEVTYARTAARKMERMALFDALTGLPNRAQLFRKLEATLQTFRLDARPFAVLCVDLDAFKDVNDTLGHLMGDKLLIEVSRRLKACLRPEDFVARLGGDEFVVLIAPSPTAVVPSAICERLIAEIGRPYDIEGQRLNIGASAGVALAPAQARSAEEILANADLALYHAKEQGRGCYRHFTAEMQAKAERRRRLGADLRNATANRELDLYYQPIVDGRTGQIEAFEALVRWRHPTEGLVSPAEFIPIAEESGMIVDIGQWVLERACHDATTWPDQIRVAVNVSPLQFRRGDILQRVKQVLAVSGLPARRLEIEVTESVVIQDPNVTLQIFEELAALGVRLALDDFGTGYSSLSYLSRFPFHKIKIDRAFVKSIDNSKSLAVVGAMTQLAKSLDAKLVAEGVETREQLEVLIHRGVTSIQGFLYSQPRPLDEVADMIEASFPAQRCA